MGLFDFLHRGKVEATEPVEHKDYYQDQPNSVPTPTGDFSLEVEDVFTITGRDYAQAGDNVGLLLRGVDRNDVSRGDILTK